MWVPGPWHDPALLEWQRGGRFELKIFPIPKKGSRRVVLAYTQLVDQAAGLRRFVLPLAHDASGTTKVDSFDLDVQVLGADKSVGVQTRGYELTSASAGGNGQPDGSAAPSVDGERRTMHADAFVPAGDLTVEYALPGRDKEVTSWAYAAPLTTTAAADIPNAVNEAPASSSQPARAKAKSGAVDAKAEQRVAEQLADSLVNDSASYVAISIKPKLPRWSESKERVHAIVVDASRSMFGERFARATRLAGSIVREMDRRDTFVLLACDTTCKPMPADDGGSTAHPASPGAPAAEKVERFLSQVEPDGGSDLAEAIREARSVAGTGRELRVIYLGDGTPTVGPTKSAHLEAATRQAIGGGDASVVAVPLGSDADTTTLQAMARGGGGVLVPYVPGQRVASAALDVLAAAYGEVLREPVVELPAGLSQVTPSRLDPIRAGGEAIVVARMTDREASGSLKLKGKVGSERFEQTYPIKIVTTSNAGNAFVPRLFAAAKIAELERDGGDSAKPTAIALSRRFSVASRFTSLLVLESEAMFKAFGVDHSAAGGGGFTGEQAAEERNRRRRQPGRRRRRLGRGRQGGSREGQRQEVASPNARARATVAPGGNAGLGHAPYDPLLPPSNRYGDGDNHGSGRWRAGCTGRASSPRPQQPPRLPRRRRSARRKRKPRPRRRRRRPRRTRRARRRSRPRRRRSQRSGSPATTRASIRASGIGVSARSRCGGAASFR